MANIYVGSTKYAAVTPWAASTAYAVGNLRRQLATPSVGNERVFRCTTAGTSGASEPAWTLTAGGTTNDGTAVWTEVTGQAAYNAGGLWNAPHARLANAEASGWSSAGDQIRIRSTHAETQPSAISQTSQGTPAAAAQIISVDDTDTALSAGASITSTGASSITLGGYGYFYGIAWNVGTTSGNFLPVSGNNVAYYDNCTVNLASSSNVAVIQTPGASASKDAFAEWRNCGFVFANASQKITPAYGRSEMVNCQFAASGVAPSALFGFGANQGGSLLVVRDSDLSSIAGALVNVATAVFGDILLVNCKLAAGVAITSGSFSSMGGARVRMHNCDSGATNYRLYEASYAGVFQSDTTNTRTGGYSDGTTALGWAFATSANSSFAAPMTSPELVIWNDVIGSAVTATVEIAGNATLTNGEAWMTVEYPGSSASPQASLASTRKADLLASAAAIPSSTASWGGSTTTKQKFQATFTPQMKGPIKVRFHVAKPSAIVYVDPLISLA